MRRLDHLMFNAIRYFIIHNQRLSFRIFKCREIIDTRVYGCDIIGNRILYRVFQENSTSAKTFFYQLPMIYFN